jgi:hypothetical protein
MTNYKKLTDKNWAKIQDAFENTDGSYMFSVNDVEFELDITYSGRCILWLEGEVIAYSYDGTDDLRYTIEYESTGEMTV